MDRAEARRVLDHEVARLKALAHAEAGMFARRGHVEVVDVEGTAGVRYMLEATFHWDADEGGPVRVICGIDDGTLLASYSPLLTTFLIEMAPS